MAATEPRDDTFDDLDGILLEAFASDRAEASAPDDLKQSERRYEIDCEIGRGGQGVVYRARDVHLDRPVALKVLTGLHGSSESRLARFQREARVASRVNHPGICAVFDHGTRHGVPYITMPLLQGESLAGKIARARWEKETAVTLLEEATKADSESGTLSSSSFSKGSTQVVRFIEKVALALHAAHEAGIVHRDVKPGNIMVTPEGGPVLFDFGLARDSESEGLTVTQSGEVFGTPAYMSPEQLTPGSKDVDRRTDVYSLGIVLFEALTLQRPFDDEIRTSRRDLPTPNPRRVNSVISRDLSVVIQTALDPDRQRRYPTALALAEDLRRVLAREPIHARSASVGLRVRRWVQRNPTTTGAGLALTAGLVTSILFMLEARDARDESDRHLAEWQILADSGRAAQLVAEANEDLWPATPDRAPRMESWIARAEDLVGKLPEHRRVLAVLERKALPYDEPTRRRDREHHQEEFLLAQTLDRQIEQARSILAGLEPGSRRHEHLEQQLEEHVARRASLEPIISERLTWEFEGATDRWRHAQQKRVIETVAALAAEDEHGPTIAGMKRRLAFASSVHERTVVQPAAAWQRVRTELEQDERFAGLSLEPQLGLVPLGRDPVSQLQEFAVVQTGEVPERAPDTGKLLMAEASALVLVLVPGGRGWMGAQADDPNRPDYLQSATNLFGPVHEVELAPFFISKYEMTQGQWIHVTGANPSATKAGTVYTDSTTTELHPVESVTWDECVFALNRIGCRLPTETQWEYACRAGTRTTWFTGNTEQSLFGYVNLADETGARFWGRKRRRIVEGLDDGFMAHAPVGSFRPNAWGLHDVHGNVWETCFDAPDYGLPPQPPDGRRPSGDARRHHVSRGGSFTSHGAYAASATRNFQKRDHRFYETGVRPIRMIDGRD